MKILVVYASAGAGHFKAAEGIYNYLRIFYPQVETKLIDILEDTSAFFKDSYAYGYPFLVKHALAAWQIAFYATSLRPLQWLTRFIAAFLNQHNTKKFTKILIEENPDFVISTHFLSSETTAFLRRTHKIKTKLVTVVTDFGVHPFWVCKGTDFYVAASGYTKRQLTSQGVAEEQIKVFGIPVDPKFLEQHDRFNLAHKFGINPEKFTVLIATGSFGIGPIEEIVELLHKEAQILVVCARNQELYQKLKNKNYPQARIFHFIDNIEELMAVSDIIITKPGGLSISESLIMELLPVFIAPIPGQETENIEALEHYGVGIYPNSLDELKMAVLNFRENPEMLKSVKEAIRKLKRPFAAKEISDAVCQGSIGAAN